MNSSERYQSEADFFNKRMEEHYLNRNEYRLHNELDYRQLFEKINQFKEVARFFGDIKEKKILDVGCGNGWISLYFGRSNAHAWCVDVSPNCIEVAKRFVRENGLEDIVTPMVMAAEHLEFEDEFFDLVFVNAALHHCNIERATKEIHRVLKKDGQAAMIEDFGYHPFMRIYRAITPGKHTPHEKALNTNDIEWIRGLFDKSEIYYYQLLNFVDLKGRIGQILDRVDGSLLHTFPIVKKYCRLVGIHLVK